MRIKKVDSKSIILHEETEVKFKTAGNMREVQFSAGVNRRCPIQNITKDRYLDRETGEIKDRNLKIITSLPKVSERVSTN